VDWEEEKPCLEGVCRELGLFFGCDEVMLEEDEDARESDSLEKEDETVNGDGAEEFMDVDNDSSAVGLGLPGIEERGMCLLPTFAVKELFFCFRHKSGNRIGIGRGVETE
jgi:hypothetical protein